MKNDLELYIYLMSLFVILSTVIMMFLDGIGVI